MSIPSEVKQAIARDWLKEFPELSAYAQNKLYKIIGPIIVGVEIFKQPRADEYRPYFVSYALWKDDLRECLREPLTLQEIRAKHGLQFDIPYLTHDRYFKEAVQSTKEQVSIPLKQDVPIRMLFEMINRRFDDVLVRSSPVNQAKLFELKYCAALYVEDVVLMNQIVNEIQNVGKHWIPKFFEWKHGSFDNWLESLCERKHKRAAFISQIELNISNRKLVTLQRSELIP